MTTKKRWAKIESELDTIWELDHDEKESYLEKMETENPDLHEEVTELLNAFTESESFLDESVIKTASDFIKTMIHSGYDN